MKVLGYNISIFNISKERPESSDPEDKVFPFTKSRIKQTIAKWRQALLSAESTTSPNRNLLYDIYRDAELDLKISSLINQRIEKTRSQKFHICNENGDIDEYWTKKFNSSWFYLFMKHFILTKFWGYTLITWDSIEDDVLKGVKEVDRYHVRPDLGLVTFSQRGEEGNDYINDPSFEQWTTVFDNYDLGSFNKIAPYFLMKKFSLSAWNEFVQKFGHPIRLGKTNNTDADYLAQFDAALEKLSTNTFMRIDHDDEIEFVEAMSKMNNVSAHELLIKYCDNMIAQEILGQSGTTEEKSFVGSAEVHERVADQIVQSDQREMTAYVNEVFIPKLINLGMGLSGKYFKFDTTEKVSLLDQSTIDERISRMGFKIDSDYITEKYGTVVGEINETEEVLNKIKASYARN